MVLPDRIELSTSPLPMECSTTELRQQPGRRQRISDHWPDVEPFWPILPSIGARLIDSAMTSGEQGKDGGRAGIRKGDERRTARLRAALRENLKRRKLQARGRSQGDAAHDSAGIVPDKSKD